MKPVGIRRTAGWYQHIHSRWVMWLGSLLLMLATAARADDAPRVALVIGNSSYLQASLPNPVRDAQAMSKALAALGFEVIELRNATRGMMLTALERWRSRLAGRNGIGLFFYAGHGAQVEWRNYLLPVDASPRNARELVAESVDVGQVLTQLKQAGTRMNIVVLDACRDNPFSEQSSGKGLAQMDAPSGTLLAYATAPGNTADDGDSGNGLYTAALLKELERPGEKIEDIFKRTRLAVRMQSQGRQIPWESTSLEEDFYFQARLSANDRAVEEASVAELVWWNKIKGSSRSDDFVEFLMRYPSGMLADVAQGRLDQLQAPKVLPVMGRDGLKRLPPGQPRFYTGDVFEYRVSDHYTKLQTGTFKQVVTAATDTLVSINGGTTELDQMGNLLKNRFGPKDRPVITHPADMEVGKRWRVQFATLDKNGSVSSRADYSFQVTGIESITVPAGVFRCYRLEQSGWGGNVYRENVYWVDPETFIDIRRDVHERQGTQRTMETYELLKFTPGPGRPAVRTVQR